MSLRIALVSAFPPGRQSLNEYGLHLAKAMAENPNVSEVVVIADKLERPEPELDLGRKVRVERVWTFNSVTASAAILKALWQENIDASIWNLHAASFGDGELTAALGLIAPALARVTSGPSGVIAHNLVAGVDLDSTKLKGRPLRQAIVRAGGALVTRLMLGASYTTVTLKSYHQLLTNKHPGAAVFHVPHGTFDTVDHDTLPLKARPKRIVTMGKFGTYKRLETLFEAFDILRLDDRFKDYELVVGGTDHPNTPGYVDKALSRRVSDPGIRKAGYIAEEDIPELFGNARISVFDYSSTTGSSGVLHQTASYGTLPVFPAIGDFVDVSRDEGLNGGHYEPNNAADMARALERGLEDLEAAQEVADSNLRASRDLPMSDIVAFHLRQLFPRSEGIASDKVAAA